MTTEQAKALRMICDAVIESVKVAGPLGAPAGTLYAALMTHGATLEQFESLMAGLVKIGKLTKQGHLYFAGTV
jgi:hypothetical protein